MQQEKSTLIPQFTVWRMFVVTTLLVILFVVVSMAFRGAALAKSMVAMVVVIGVCFLLFAVLYSAAWLLGRLRRQPAAPESPFASDVLPPRHVAPENE